MKTTLRHVVNVARAALHEAHKKATRSPKWRAVEMRHLRTNPSCAACQGAKRLQVHHVKPFHVHPELELDPTNLITLCMGVKECHLLIGHGDDFKKSNPNVVAHAAIVRVHPELYDEAVKRAKAAAV